MNALRQFLDRQVFSGLMFVRIRPEPGRIALPDMCCDLVWRGERLMLSGPMSRGHAIESHGGEIQLLNLDPLAFRALAGMPMVELTDQCIPIADLLPDLAGPMAELFFTGRAGDLVEAPSRRRHHPRIGRAAEAIRAGATVAKAAELVSLSVRQLER